LDPLTNEEGDQAGQGLHVQGGRGCGGARFTGEQL